MEEGVEKRTGGLTAEEALLLQQVWEEVNAIDLSVVEKERQAKLSNMEKLLEDAKLGKKLERKFGEKRKPGRPKLHWKTRAANRKLTKSKYYQNTWKPRRTAEIVEQLSSPEGWYEYVTKRWKGEVFGKRQWMKYLWPKLEGRVPVFKRLDTSRGFTMDNIIMYESGSRNILFCPEDYELAKMNATL